MIATRYTVQHAFPLIISAFEFVLDKVEKALSNLARQGNRALLIRTRNSGLNLRALIFDMLQILSHFGLIISLVLLLFLVHFNHKVLNQSS